MALKNILNKDLVTCSPSASVYEVAHLMKEHDVGAVLVVEDGSPEGIVTDRDLVLRCIANEVDCAEVRVEEIMSEVVETVFDDEGIYAVAEKMKDARVRRIPVIDSEGVAVGLLSFDDVFQLIGEEIYNLKEAIQPYRPKIENQAA